MFQHSQTNIEDRLLDTRASCSLVLIQNARVRKVATFRTIPPPKKKKKEVQCGLDAERMRAGCCRRKVLFASGRLKHRVNCLLAFLGCLFPPVHPSHLRVPRPSQLRRSRLGDLVSRSGSLPNVRGANSQGSQLPTLFLPQIAQQQKPSSPRPSSQAPPGLMCDACGMCHNTGTPTNGGGLSLKIS